MRWQHLKAILWLRWRLRMNRWRRDGLLNAVVMMAFAVLALAGSAVAFVLSLVLGLFQLENAEPNHLMLIWDGLVFGFLIFWMIDLVTELQRSESLSLENLLHLPISLTGTFLLNYLTSLVCFPLLAFVPVAAGLSIAMVIVKGPASLMMIPLLLGFILMVTGVTYQFRGWLASLMVNKRRRRTIVAIVTMGFVLLSIVPSLLNTAVFRPRRSQARQERRERAEERREAKRSDPDNKKQREEARRQRQEQRDRERERIFTTVAQVNMAVPFGWLPYGARASASGQVLPGLLGSLAAMSIGAWSLWRSHRTTLRIYTGDYQAGKPRASPEKTAAPIPAQATKADAPRLLEIKLNWVSEYANAIALANFRSLTRAPETKMMMLTPVILVVVFGSMLFSGRGQGLPEMYRPLLGIAAIVATMLGFLQLLQNQFGFDRNGFRVYVLTPAPRSDVLLGKNLSVAPCAIGMAVLGLAVLQFTMPMRISHFAATIVQLAPIYALFCLAGNLVSIIAPTAIKSGSLNAAKPKIVTVLIQLVCMSLYPVALLPALIPLGIDLLLTQLGWEIFVPVYLILSIVEAGFILWFYRRVLVLQGQLLQARERKILEVVTAQVE